MTSRALVLIVLFLSFLASACAGHSDTLQDRKRKVSLLSVWTEMRETLSKWDEERFVPTEADFLLFGFVERFYAKSSLAELKDHMNRHSKSSERVLSECTFWTAPQCEEEGTVVHEHFKAVGSLELGCIELVEPSSMQDPVRRYFLFWFRDGLWELADSFMLWGPSSAKSLPFYCWNHDSEQI